MTYRYNGDGHMDRVEHKRDTTLTAWYGYTLDARGWRTGADEGRNGVFADTIGWEYDNLGRLTKETISGDGQVGYAYDAVGNRQDRTSSIASVPAQALGYDDNDRLAVTGYAFDASGNTVQSPNGTDVYDSFERLVKHTAINGAITSIRYDGDGKKVAETVNGVARWFLIDGMNPTGYTQTVHELSGPLTALKVERSVYTGLDVLGYADHLITGSEGRWLDYDGHGTVRGLVKADGTPVSQYDYDAFGIQAHGQSVAMDGNRYRYAGEEFHPSLGLSYNRARFLDVGLGRFTNMDSFPGLRDEPLSLHRYLYGNANPVMFRDPSGQWSLAEIFGSLAISISLPTATVSGLALRFTVGAFESLKLQQYADYYLPSTSRELDMLATALIPASLHSALAVMELKGKVDNLYHSMTALNISRPFVQLQLGAFVGMYELYSLADGFQKAMSKLQDGIIAISNAHSNLSISYKANPALLLSRVYSYTFDLSGQVSLVRAVVQSGLSGQVGNAKMFASELAGELTRTGNITIYGATGP